jgi:HK97 family phage prohead protease
MQEKAEVRSFRMQVRAADGRPPIITGLPIVFNVLSQDLGGFRERILPSAVEFDADVKADFNHNPDYILGRESNGTLRLQKMAAGYEMTVTPPDTAWARDLMTSVSRGDIDGGSFAFMVKPNGQKWSEEGGESIRTLTAIKVRAVSVVSNPAYLGTAGSFLVRSV